MTMQLSLPMDTRQPPSHVIVNRATGKAVQEVFGRKPALAPVLLTSYEVVPILEWLHRVNMAARATRTRGTP
jgi:hypothetical protein